MISHLQFNILNISYITSTFIPHGLIRTHTRPAPNVSGFIAQLVRASHRYHKVTGSHPIKVLNFSGSYTGNSINCVKNWEDHSLLDTVSMLSKLKYVREFFFFVQFEMSHKLHLPPGRPLCNTTLIHYPLVNHRKLR